MEEVFITAFVFGGIYMIIKVFTDYLLKKRLINTGHVEKAEILEPAKDKEVNSYPTLKWGLVSFFAGAGLVLIAFISRLDVAFSRNDDALFFGIELVAISLGFLVYFAITRVRKN